MRYKVISPHNIILTYLFHYGISIPLFIALLLSNDTSTGGRIIRFAFLVFTAAFMSPWAFGKCWPTLFHTIEISEKGLEYNSGKNVFRMNWDEVQQIIVLPDKYGRMTGNCFICFFSDECKTFNLQGCNDFNSKMIGVQYRKKVAEVIREYTDMPIELLDRI